MPGAGEVEVADLAAAVRDTYRSAEDALLTVVADEARRAWRRGAKPNANRRRDLLEQANATARVGAHAARIARRLDRDLPDTADHVTQAAHDRGQRAGARELDALLGRQTRRRAKGRDPGRNPELVRASRALVDTLTPAHRSILRTTRDAYRDATADLLGPYAAGAINREDMARRAMARLGDQGVTEFRDAAGRRWELASYVEQATRSAAARVMVEAQLDRLADDGVDLVVVGDVQGECALCRPWEGQVLTRDGMVGRQQVRSVLTDELVDVDVAGTVAEAYAAGYGHPSCRHALLPYVPGATRLPTDTEDPQGEADRSRLRALERHVRHWKRREEAAFDAVDKARAKTKMRDWQAAIREHTEQTGLVRQPKREKVGPGVAR